MTLTIQSVNTKAMQVIITVILCFIRCLRSVFFILREKFLIKYPFPDMTPRDTMKLSYHMHFLSIQYGYLNPFTIDTMKSSVLEKL